MTIAGITGTIGTGKSTVASMFAGLGAFVIDADKIAHEVVEPGRPAWKGILDAFGSGILNTDQTLNRQALAGLVFQDPVKLRQLNSIVHPEVLKEDSRLVEARKAIDPSGLIIKDIPLLLEMGRDVAYMLVNKIIVVYCSPDVQLTRLIARGMEKNDARQRIANQVPVSEKLKQADYTVNNDGTLEQTMEQVRSIYQNLISGQPA